MRVAVGLASLALLTGCTPSRGADNPPASLIWPPDISDEVEAFPRLVGDTPQVASINAMLVRLEAFDRGHRQDCLAVESENVDWSRSVEAPMIGPRFVTILISGWSYCGGTHGNAVERPLTFDLQTGKLVDWSALLPRELASPRYEATHYWPQLLRSSSLKAWYADRAIARRKGGPEEGLCAEALAADEPLLVWLDARAGGLTMQVEGLAYAASGCNERVTLSVADLRRRGADEGLLRAVVTAHRQRLWRAARPEPRA